MSLPSGRRRTAATICEPLNLGPWPFRERPRSDLPDTDNTRHRVIQNAAAGGSGYRYPRLSFLLIFPFDFGGGRYEVARTASRSNQFEREVRWLA